MWRHIQPAPPDSILGLTDAFRKDPSPNKVNLGVGVYKDNNGNTPILKCVKAAEKKLLTSEITKSYLPISGDPSYASEVQKLMFGPDSEVIASKRAMTVHAPGGTGALRVGADLLKKFNPDAKVWVSSPTWANHNGVFESADFEIERYSYYNSQTKQLDFEEMANDLRQIPAGDIVLLHTCCHNPSGVDLIDSQWQQIATIGKEKSWIPFLDFAYQGFGFGVEEDRLGVELFSTTGIDFLVASSFSKNFGLYNERAGALTVVCSSPDEAITAMSHLKTIVRVLYSNPPAHGGLIAATILADPDLRSQWIEELADMRNRIVTMRTQLVDGLAACGIDTDFSYIKEQHGMFSFSGLSNEIVVWLREQKSIYVVGGGRINLAGLTTTNIDYVCQSISEAIKAE